MNAPAERASAQGADAWMRKLPAGAAGNTLRLKTVAPSLP